MGGLSMNPDNHGVEGAPRLAEQIAKEEDELGLNISTKSLPVQAEEKNKKDKLKIAGFQLDTTYPRTVPGFIRILQVLTLVVAFICLLLGSWPDQGSYTFYCLFLVFGALISSYLLFTVVAGTRGEHLFGIAWRTVELVYFGVFGLLIFIGACLAANKSGGLAALNAGAVFGFFAVATFGYYFYVTWKSTGKSEEEKPAEGEGSDAEDVAKATASQSGADDYRLEMLDEKEEELQRRQSRDYRGNSLPVSLNDELYENGKVVGEGFNSQRRRQSNSEKDSAYSEGTSTPTRGKMLPQKMRRTGSGFNLGQQFRGEEYDHVTDRQPLSHMTHRGRHGGSFRGRSLHQERAVGYPQELNAHSFHNPGFEADDLHRNSGRRKSMPEWLRAALGEDVQQDDMIDDESVMDHTMQRVQTLPPGRNHEFPLLNESDEESINYPSVSQNGLPPGSRLFSQSLPYHKRRRSAGGALKHHNHNHHHHGGATGRRRLGSRRHHHHHRHHHNRRSQHHHPHHRGPKHHGSRGAETARRPVTGAQEDYLRRMVGSDELLMREERKDGIHGFQPLEGRPIETGKRRVIPEQPISIHFPEQSRWDDDNIENPLMTKYFHDAQQMRA